MANSSRGPSVGIVTVAYRSNDVLAGFLDSVAAASRDRPAVVVVDNAPGDGRRDRRSARKAGRDARAAAVEPRLRRRRQRRRARAAPRASTGC